jgi:hypothetical protein
MARLAAVSSWVSAWCEKPGSASKIAWVTFVVLVVVGYPGMMTEDSVRQLVEARANSFTGKHPPVYGYIWRCLDQVIAGPAGMLVLQAGLAVFGLYTLGRHLSKDFPATLRTLLPLFLLWPAIQTVFVVIWKDTLMAAAALSAYGLALGCGPEHKPGHRRACFGATIALTWLAVAVRHNALALAPLGPPFVAAWLLAGRYQRPTHRLLAAAALSLVVASGVAVTVRVANSALSNDEAQHYYQYFMKYDLTGISIIENR